MFDQAPHDNDIRRVMDACLPGLENRPDFDRNVLRQVRGEKKVKKKLSVGFALIFLFVLVAVTALAISVFANFFKLEQASTGALMNCASIGDTLYLMTADGLRMWTPGETEAALLIPREELNEYGLSTNSWLYKNGVDVGLLDITSMTVWQYNNGKLSLEHEYPTLVLPEVNIRNVIYDNGALFLCTLPSGASEDEKIILRANMQTGDIHPLSRVDVREICAYKPGRLLALTTDIERGECGVIVLDAVTGDVLETLYNAPIQEVQGIAYDETQDELYALVNGSLSRWNGTSWTAIQGYAANHVADAFAVVGGGYVAVSSHDMQYIPFTHDEGLNALTIRGYITADNIDADFQQAYHGMSVVRERAPSLTAEDVRIAIEAGDTTDLFYLTLDGDLTALISDGLIVPLTASDMLMADAGAILPSISEGFYRDGELFAVACSVSVSTWQAEDSVPATFEELLSRHAEWQAESPFLAWNGKDSAWGKADYSDYLLTSTIAEASRLEKSVDFHDEEFIKALVMLRQTVLPMAGSGDAAITCGITMTLQGKPSKAITSMVTQNNPLDVTPVFRQSIQALPPTISADAEQTVPTRVLVYLLNPNAQNPKAAIAYLEYLSQHRLPEDEALLKPYTSQPILHPYVQQWIDQISAEQRETDETLGIQTDEAALQARVDAICDMPESWDVTEENLAVYRENIVPHLELRLSPLLASSSRKDGGTYNEMLQAITDYVNGGCTLEECLEQLEMRATDYSINNNLQRAK